MKAYVSLVLGMIVSIVSAQEKVQTIYCNEFQNVALVMSAPIAQAVTGSENFVFSYNQAAPDSLGLLQGRPGENSNLLIRTRDGGLYSYILEYKDSLSDFVHFINPNNRINPTGNTSKKRMHEMRGLRKDQNKKYYEKLSAYYLKRSPQKITAQSKDKLILEVQGVYYYKEEVFMVMEIGNRSEIDFKIDDFSLTKVHGSKGRKTSFQKLLLEDLYHKDLPELIRSNSRARFVMVYPKFTLGDYEKLKLQVTEKSGSRYLKLTFD